jgi:hypothetical protein
MTEEARLGEVIEASTMGFSAQCYELYQSPALGSIVTTREGEMGLYGLVYNVSTAGIEPGRRPVARGKDETSEADVYRSNPQLLKLLRSEFQVLVVGFEFEGKIRQFLPPNPARIHSFVYACPEEKVLLFSRSFDFLNILLKSRLEIPVEELVAATLRQMSRVHGAGAYAFLVEAGKELASLLSFDYGQLRAILKGLKNAAI